MKKRKLLVNSINDILDLNTNDDDDHAYLNNLYLIQFLISIRNGDLSKPQTINTVYSLYYRYLSIEVLICCLCLFIFSM